jgi:hypothetical protein
MGCYRSGSRGAAVGDDPGDILSRRRIGVGLLEAIHTGDEWNAWISRAVLGTNRGGRSAGHGGVGRNR